ncbi:spore cortex biosynthesis protein YabQ [Paenibacillus yanchengensis]|uniref:Spore cortex biosynthesis protein YabQ n=1 Tax=Paenibacillus yanchengensis TaxID=2035833 RepID=A0ABW4YIF0_9BACL
MTLSVQWLTIAAMMSAGLGMGIVFDGYRIFSNALKFPRWWLPILDLMYWIAAAIVVFQLLYASNNGEVRAYVFVGLVIGIVVYHWLFHRMTVVLFHWIIQAGKAVLLFLKRLLHFIIVKPVYFMYNVLKFVLGIGSAITIFIGNLVVQLMRPLWRLLMWLLRPLTRLLHKWLTPIWSRVSENSQLNKWMMNLKSIPARWMNWLRRK